MISTDSTSVSRDFSEESLKRTKKEKGYHTWSIFDVKHSSEARVLRELTVISTCITGCCAAGRHWRYNCMEREKRQIDHVDQPVVFVAYMDVLGLSSWLVDRLID
jgi:hypothetical protein